jgi:hypothetical protein
MPPAYKHGEIIETPGKALTSERGENGYHEHVDLVAINDPFL